MAGRSIPRQLGRRPPAGGEINWDGVPAALTNVDTFPAFFFNVNSKRGVVFTTKGSGFRVDSTDFAAVNSGLHVAIQVLLFEEDLRADRLERDGGPLPACRVAGAWPRQWLRGDLSDVDRVGSTVVEFFDADGVRLARLEAPARSAAHEFSFVGGRFAASVVARVRITSGEAGLTGTVTDLSNGGPTDLVAMDDFIFGEPQPSR